MKKAGYTVTAYMISNRSTGRTVLEILLGELLSGKRKAVSWVQTQTQRTNLQEVQHKYGSN